jgi:hypothetical protein
MEEKRRIEILFANNFAKFIVSLSRYIKGSTEHKLLGK